MKYLVENKYWNIVEDYNIDKLLYLLIDRPNEIKEYTNVTTILEFFWKNNNKKGLHRDYDLPDYASKGFHTTNTSIFWHNNSNKKHRDKNKPAVIYGSGQKRYYTNNILLKETFK